MSALHLSGILRKLRPPYALPARVVYGFSRTEPTNYGLTLAIDSGTPLVAPGDGTVDLISQMGGRWRNDAGALHSTAIRIDHGRGVKSWVHGISTVTTNYGPITRGRQIGLAHGPQVFFGIEHNGAFQDPTHINPNFGIQDGFLNYGKTRTVRQAPDLITTVFSDVVAVLVNGIQHFFPPSQAQVLFNVDFNGQGDKNGAAVIGAEGDGWNIVSPLDFLPETGSPYGYCYGGVIFPAPQGFFLNDYRGAASKVYFERLILTADAGVSAFFDPMLSSWVGGYDGMSARTNAFSIRNLPGGTYSVYVYSNGGTTNDTTTVYFSADEDTPTMQIATPTVTADWVEGRNYLRQVLTVSNRGRITILAYGYLAGLQLLRTSV